MIVRIGTVTNVYSKEGKVRVLYEDRDETSVKLPVLAFEYHMPPVGAAVVALHMEGRSGGVVLGEYWNDDKKPEESGEGMFRKELGDKSYMRCTGGKLTIYSPELIMQGEAGAVTLEQLVAILDRATDLENRVSRLEAVAWQ